MAIYHFSAQIISRSKGKSVVASASYRSGDKLHDERIDETFDYSRKQKIDGTEIHAPDHAPDWVHDRERLWNAVERAEKNKNAQLAREINIALPTELNADQNKELVRKYVQDNFVKKGMVADIAYHDLQGKNPHSHIMLTMRPITPDGTFTPKSKKVYVLDEKGQKIKLPSGQYKSYKERTTDWDQQDTLAKWRESWTKHANKFLEIAGTQERIDHRSLEAQKINRLPQIHVGVHANAMAKRGMKSDRYDQNEALKAVNHEKERLKKEEKELQKLLEKPAPEEKKESLQDRIKEIRANQSMPAIESPMNRTYEELTQTYNQIENQFIQARDQYSDQLQVTQKLIRETKDIQEKIRTYNGFVERANKLNTKIQAISPFNPFKREERKKLKQEFEREQSHAEKLGKQNNPQMLEKRQDELLGQLRKEEEKLYHFASVRDEYKKKLDPLRREKDSWNKEFDLDRAKDSLSRFQKGEKLPAFEAKNLLRHAQQLKLDTAVTHAVRSVVRLADPLER